MARNKPSFKPKSPPPTVEYIYGLYETGKADGQEARLRLIAQTFRELCKLDHKVKIPEQYQAITTEVRTPFVRDTWYRTSAALVQKTPVGHVEPIDQTEDARRAANIAERWDMAAIEAMDKDQNGKDTIHEDAKECVRDGESVIKVVHRPDAWAHFPKRVGDEDADDYNKRADRFKKGAPIPFAWRTVDRLSMLFGEGEYGATWALEYGEYPTTYLGGRYDMTPDPQRGYLTTPEFLLGGRPQPEGWLTTAFGRSVKVEFVDADWWAVVIDGSMAPGFPKPNPYAPDLPYFRARAPDSESMLYSLAFLVPALDNLLTMKMNWAYLGAYPNPIIESVPNTLTTALPLGDDGQPTKWVWKPGKMLYLPPGKVFKFASPPPVGQDIDQLVAILRSLIDIAGVPSVFRGIGASDQAGYAINQLMAAANLAFKAVARSLQHQIERCLEFIHRQIPRRIGQTVYVLGTGESSRHWLGLRPEGSVTATEAPVNLLGPVTFSFRPVLPTDEQARAMVANQLVNAPKPLLSRKRALERYLQEEDPEGVLDEIAVEDALEQEPLKSKMIERALRDAGLLEPTPNPAGQLVRPDGTPLLPGGGQPGQMPPEGMAGIPGQAAAGLPAIPGLTMPLGPQAPAAPPIGPGGGNVAGMFPGQPPLPQGHLGGV